MPLTSVRRNAIANIIGRAVTAVLWVAITPFVLNRLGAERFGIWALFFAFGGYLMTFNLGIGNAMIRFIAIERASGDRHAIVKTLVRGMQLSIALGLLWALVVVVVREGITQAFRVPTELVPETLTSLMIFAVGVFFTFPVQTLTGALQGFERLDSSNLATVVGVVAHVVALYLGLSAGGGLLAVAAAGVIGQAVTTFLGAALLWRPVRETPSETRGPGPRWRDLLHFGAAMQMINGLSILQYQIGKIMLGLLGSLAMVSDYEVASRVASGVAAIPFLVIAALVPAVTRVWESGGPSELTPMFNSSLRWLYPQTVLVLGVLWVLAPDITQLWLGPQHHGVAGLIRLWVVAYAVNLAWIPTATVARSIGAPWLEVWSLTACVLSNVALGFWLIPSYGTAGAIVAMALSFMVGFLTFLMLFRRAGLSFGPWIRRELLPRAVAGALVVVLCSVALARPLARLLPGPGWTHGFVAAALFVAVFALLFSPFGDTQRFFRTTFEMMSGARLGRRDLPSS